MRTLLKKCMRFSDQSFIRFVILCLIPIYDPMIMFPSANLTYCICANVQSIMTSKETQLVELCMYITVYNINIFAATETCFDYCFR